MYCGNEKGVTLDLLDGSVVRLRRAMLLDMYAVRRAEGMIQLLLSEYPK